MYEQRIQRSWSLNPRELWTVMRTQANRHINGVDTTNIVGSFEQQGLDFVQYAVGNSGTTPGTFAANILFYKLVQITNPLFSSMVSYLIPIVAIGWGFYDGELITIYHFIGFILILFGVYLSKSKNTNK